MRPWIPLSAMLFCVAGSAFADDACPRASLTDSAKTADLSWTTGTGRSGTDRICTRHQISRTAADSPLAMAWQEAGVLSAQIGPGFVSSFCCFEAAEVEKSTLRYGDPPKSLEARVQSGAADDDDNYPDLIEDDAKSRRSSFIGKLWDGTQYINVDIEFLASASYAHLNQSVFQFIIVDRSSQPVIAEWNLLAEMRKTMQPYYSRTSEGGRRQAVYVFFARQRPSPMQGNVTVKTGGGKLLGRFIAAGFMPGK